MSAALRSRQLLSFVRRCHLVGLEWWHPSSAGDRTCRSRSRRSLESASCQILDRARALCQKLNRIALDVEATVVAASSRPIPGADMSRNVNGL